MTLAPRCPRYAAQLIGLGLEDLSLRVQRHSDNALAVAKWLKENPKVTWVRYSGLEDDPSHETATRLFKHGFGGALVFGVKGGREAGLNVVNNVKLFTHLANVGDAKSSSSTPPPPRTPSSPRSSSRPLTSPRTSSASPLASRMWTTSSPTSTRPSPRHSGVRGTAAGTRK